MGLKSNKQWGRIYVAPVPFLGRDNSIVGQSRADLRQGTAGIQPRPDPDTAGHRAEGIGIR